MKKIYVSFLLIITLPAFADSIKSNPMFGNDTDNAVALYVSQGTSPGSLLKLINPFLWDFEPMTNFMVQYSQPMEIFRLPSRMNISLVQNLGYSHDDGLNFIAAGISWDVSLVDWHGFYIGVGIGPYMRDSGDRYVESRLVFGERVFIGKNVSDRWRIEWFTQHFSNGSFTEINRGFNFTGLAINYSF